METIITQDRITLKHLKVADFASEETLCFTATVLFDGVAIADARNDGHGGSTFIRALGGQAARLAEAEAFAMAAAYLRDARTRPADRVLLARALGFNQKLWTIIQAEISDTGHPAPEDVRGDMMSLARFMDQATADALAGPPTRWPVNATARSMKNLPAPERISSAPKMMNKTI